MTDMLDIALIRLRSNDQGTSGILMLPCGTQFHTLELPWRDNQRSISCIPSGEYKVATYRSPRRGLVYCVQHVPDRSSILIHSGNFAGDTKQGWLTHSEGCILLGKRDGVINGQEAVLVSRVAMREFLELTKGEPFYLHIEDIT